MNIDLKRKKEKRNAIVRWVLYSVTLALCFVIMTTMPGNLRTPLLVIPMAMCVSMFEEPFDSALFGCVAGLLLDTALGSLMGLNGIILLWCCLASSLLFHFLMRRHIVNIIVLNAAAVLGIEVLYYFFYYAIWEYDPSGKIFTREFLPVIIYTVIMVLPFYYLVKFLKKRFGIIEESYVEEKSDDIVRE